MACRHAGSKRTTDTMFSPFPIGFRSSCRSTSVRSRQSMWMTGVARDRQTAAMAEQLVDEARVAAWMDEQDLAPGEPVTVTRITTGHSNEVFRVERGELVAVLRRPPRTPLSPTAHDMAREFRVLTAFHGAAGWNAHAPVPVPDPLALCADADVIGTPLYLMRVCDG